MNNKWFLKLLGSLLAVFLITGCNADDQDPPPEDEGLETPGEDFNEEMDNEVVPDVTPEEDAGNNGNNGNGMNGTDEDGNIIEDDNNDGDLDMGKDDDDDLGTNDDETNPGGGTGGDNGGTGGAGGGQ